MVQIYRMLLKLLSWSVWEKWITRYHFAQLAVAKYELVMSELSPATRRTNFQKSLLNLFIRFATGFLGSRVTT